MKVAKAADFPDITTIRPSALAFNANLQPLSDLGGVLKLGYGQFSPHVRWNRARSAEANLKAITEALEWHYGYVLAHSDRAVTVQWELVDCRKFLTAVSTPTNHVSVLIAALVRVPAGYTVRNIGGSIWWDDVPQGCWACGNMGIFEFFGEERQTIRRHTLTRDNWSSFVNPLRIETRAARFRRAALMEIFSLLPEQGVAAVTVH
jgi:hypothetical protein